MLNYILKTNRTAMRCVHLWAGNSKLYYVDLNMIKHWSQWKFWGTFTDFQYQAVSFSVSDLKLIQSGRTRLKSVQLQLEMVRMKANFHPTGRRWMLLSLSVTVRMTVHVLSQPFPWQPHPRTGARVLVAQKKWRQKGRNGTTLPRWREQMMEWWA